MLLLALLAISFGQDGDAAAQRCIDAARTQPEMNVCATQEWQRADRALNDAYREAVRRIRADDSFMLTSDGRPAGDILLRDLQRDWTRQRESQCQLESYSARGGSLEPFIFERCRAAVTRQRTQWLEDLLPDQPGIE